MTNLLLRIIVAAVGIPLLLWAAGSQSWPLYALIVALQAVALFEWRYLVSLRNHALWLPSAILAVAGLDLLIFAGATPRSLAGALIALTFLFLIEVIRRNRWPIGGLAASSLFLLYAALPLALWANLGRTAPRFEPAGALVVLLVTTWVCDTGAFFIGRAIGRHRLWQAASPGKTVEGFIGGLLVTGAIVPAFAALGWIATPQLWDYIALPVIVGIVGQLGDLLESLIKREAQVKDSSSLLPGHGGILDRFDSLLLSTPLFYAYLVLTAL